MTKTITIYLTEDVFHDNRYNIVPERLKDKAGSVTTLDESEQVAALAYILYKMNQDCCYVGNGIYEIDLDDSEGIRKELDNLCIQIR